MGDPGSLSGKRLRRLIRSTYPPTRFVRRTAVGLVVLCLLDTSPGMYFLHTHAAGGLFFPRAVAVIYALLTFDLVKRAYSNVRWKRMCRSDTSLADLHVRRSRRREWLLTPICLVIVLATLYCPLPVLVGFGFSRAAIERAVAADPPARGPERAGLFRVRVIRRWYNGTVFVAVGKRRWREYGFVLIPENSIGEGRPCDLMGHLSGEWYVGSYSH